MLTNLCGVECILANLTICKKNSTSLLHFYHVNNPSLHFRDFSEYMGKKFQDVDNNMSEISNQICVMCNTFYMRWWHGRYCPIVMFTLEGFSKLLTFFLVSWISINQYHTPSDQIYRSEKAENALLCIMVGNILYEFGQLQSMNFDMFKYLADTWNKLDVVSNTLIVLWALLLNNSFTARRFALALSAIPLSISLLEFLTINKTFGQLIIMIEAMTFDFLVFLIVFIVATMGFAVTFFGIFNSVPPFTNIGGTVLILFAATMGNFDFGSFDGRDSFETFGAIVLAIFVTLTGIILINLLIARMASTHQRIEESTAREWSFAKVCHIKKMHYIEYHPNHVNRLKLCADFFL